MVIKRLSRIDATLFFSLLAVSCGSSSGSNANIHSGGMAATGGGAANSGGGGSSGQGTAGSNTTVGGSTMFDADAGTGKCDPVTPKPSTNTGIKVGEWTNLGPTGVANADYGVIGVTFDNADRNVLYATVQDNGVWKSKDGGATWRQTGDPTHKYDFTDSTSYLEVPFEVAVDPCDPNHLYATNGVRGSTMGFWVSQDAGESWHRTPGFANILKTTTADVTDIAVDPNDFRHILVSSHSPWMGKPNAGILESKDAGNNWTAHPGVATWPPGTPGVEFIDPVAGIWLVMTDGNGFWRTKDSGANWTQVSTHEGIHGLTTLFRASTGTLYSGGANYPMRSTDEGVTWTPLMNGLPNAYYYAVAGDGTTLYTMKSLNNGAMPFSSYSVSPETDGMTWTLQDGGKQTFSDGPIVLKYDAVSHIMYSANWKAGIQAFKVQ